MMCNCKREAFENRIVYGKVIENMEIAKDVYKMTIGGEALLKVCEQAKAGQFVNLYMKDKSTLLPRPISICTIEKESLTLVYKVVGKGTKQMSQYIQGEEVKLSNALGNGYNLENQEKKQKDAKEDQKAVLVGGGVGIPPLLQLAKDLKGLGVKVTAVLGFQEEPYLIHQMKEQCEQIYIATENGSTEYKGNVLQLLEEKKISGDEFFSCGPKPMLKALVEYCETISRPIQVSLEERMGCGYGACVGCTCKIMVDGKIQQKAVCKDGPVFKGSEVIWHA